jgi:hypothetical protein
MQSLLEYDPRCDVLASLVENAFNYLADIRLLSGILDLDSTAQLGRNHNKRRWFIQR